MGWQDRSYYRDSSSGMGNPFMWLLTGSIPFIRVFGIQVRIHASMLLLLGFMLLNSTMPGSIGLKANLTIYGVLFAVVLLHEFGHCFAARWVRGNANEIIMTPMGGLAMADAPKRPWPQLVTTAGGPLVNVLICLVAAVIMAILNRGTPNVSWNPLSSSFSIPGDSLLAYWTWFIFVVSWGLLLFNLLPIYPLDGGRMLQELLWFRMGYHRSMMIACTVGIIGGTIMAVYGLFRLGTWQGAILFFIGLNCVLASYQTRAMLKAVGPFGSPEGGEDEEPDYASSLYDPPEKPRKHLSKRLLKQAQKREAREREEQERVDQILAKVSAHGMQSLSWWERRILRKATEHQRQKDLELKEVTRKLG